MGLRYLAALQKKTFGTDEHDEFVSVVVCVMRNGAVGMELQWQRQ